MPRLHTLSPHILSKIYAQKGNSLNRGQSAETEPSGCGNGQIPAIRELSLCSILLSRLHFLFSGLLVLYVWKFLYYIGMLDYGLGVQLHTIILEWQWLHLCSA